MNIRPYQQTALQNIIADWNSGIHRLLLMAATGTGKTIIYLAVISEILRNHPKARVMVIAHRRELIYQPVERMTQYFPALAFRSGVVMADQDDIASQIIVATIQSLASGNRLERILKHGSIDYVIVDEAHHAPAGTYTKVLDQLNNPFVLGCTATPKRSDKQALRSIFEKVSFRISIQDGIKLGALTPFTPLGFMLPADASKIRETTEGWKDEPMGELLSSANILEIVFDKWKEFAADRRTIGFTASVAQAHATAAFFNEHGIISAAVDGTTPKTERDTTLRRFQSGEIQAVFNCMVLTEGFDAPETNCVMMIAPTRSDLVYVQRLGRGLRAAKGKTDCLVLDFAPMGTRDVVMAGDVLEGIPKQVKKTVQQAEEAEVMMFGWKIDETGAAQSIDPHEIQAVVLDYLAHNKLAWSFDGRLATASLSDKEMVAILPPERERLDKADAMRRSGKWNDNLAQLADWIGKYRVYQLEKISLSPADTPKELQRYTWTAKCLGAWDSMTGAKASAEEIAKGSDNTLAGRKREWRVKPMSDAQAKYLRRLGAYKPGLTSGAAAQTITHAIVKNYVMKIENKKQLQLSRGA